VIVPTTGADGARGGELITASAEAADVHPSALVTIKLKVPAMSPEMVVLVPVPFVKIPPGLRIKVQVPPEGNPPRTTLPVGTVQVRLVMVPMDGGVGTVFTINA
jgi:hypothetical protein